ncbi:MAG TPA: hypothetical protein VGH98_16310 [Gemmatimonadaceae bacterium]
MTRFLEATRERFLVAIAANLPAERFIELHFFSPIRQGGVESGVAVIAAHPERVEPVIMADAPPEPSSVPLLGMPEAEGAKPARYTVYTAKYKLALKGPDRGKWECRVVAEADAPLVTVETVVRGVQRRAGDAEEPERMSGDDARDYLLAATR